MNRNWAGTEYTTSLTQQNAEGWIALELTRRIGPASDRIARVIFWDADGHFYLEMFGNEVPLEILEELIAEAKLKIRTG